jgi:cell division protease FtsH
VNYYLDQLCVALGAREAEKLLLDDISLGAVADLQSATSIARELVEVHGLAGDGRELVQFLDLNSRERQKDLSESTRAALDAKVAAVVEAQRARAEKIVRENRTVLVSLRDLLLERKTLDGKTLAEMFPKKK